MSNNSKAFEENMSTISDELHLAIKWRRASIILTTHRSIHSKDKTKNALRIKLDRLGVTFVEIDINKIEGNFIKHMLKYKNIENIVFFISHLDWGGGIDEIDGYRTLNLYRETIIEQQIKAIFFLTMREASKLPSYAPDFWAFRHRVLEFRNPRAYKQKRPPAGLMIWHMGNSITPVSDIKTKISGLTQTFLELPEQSESVSLQIDLLYELGFLHWKYGNLLNAEKNLKNGINLAKAHNVLEPLAKLQNGIGVILYEQGNFQSANELLDSLLDDYQHDCILQLNQAIMLFVMKKRYKAIIKGKKATSLCPPNPWTWNSLGFLYYYAGNMEDAENCFQKATAISSKVGYFHEALAVCYLAIGLADKANSHLHQAKNNPYNREIFHDFLKEHIEGNKEKAAVLIKSAMESGKLLEADITRDPILNALTVISDENYLTSMATKSRRSKL